MNDANRLPPFWKSRLSDVRDTLCGVARGHTTVIAHSPGGQPVECIAFGPANERRASANYNSAVGAGDASYYRGRPAGSPPVVMLVGALHGHEVEGIVSLLNLIEVAENGSDYRGAEWPRLKALFDCCRVLVVPAANPDGRARCTRDDFIGVPVEEMSRIGQGTRRDGTLYGWPGVKQTHPMKEDVGLLGAYFNNDGINLMHDDFFAPMAAETRALLDLARGEAPDVILNLHSHGGPPVLLRTAYVPHTCKVREYRLAAALNKRYVTAGIPTGGFPVQQEDGETDPPPSFNLTSALHHVCGALSMLFESPHGLAEPEYAQVTLEQILDLHLILFEEVFACACSSSNRER